VSLTIRAPRGAKSHWVASTESTSVRAEIAGPGGPCAPRVDVLQYVPSKESNTAPRK